MPDAEPLLADLPPGVRGTIVTLAAGVLGELPLGEVPRSLRDVHRFTPAQRTRAGAQPLGRAVQREPGFRSLVASRWRREHPDLVDLLTATEPDDGPDDGPDEGPDPIVMLTGLYLARPDGWPERTGHWQARWDGLRHAGHAREEQEPRQDAVVPARLEELTRQLAEITLERDALAEEVAGLKRERRKLRSDGDRARAGARQAEQALATEREEAAATAQQHEAAARAARDTAAAAADELERLRQSGRDRRALDEVRSRLLLDTIVDAASGLRRELTLPPAERTPADLVASTLARPEEVSAAAAMPARGLAADDPALLTELLRLPRVHLIVDGYNVTIGGWPGMALTDQRRVLVDALAGLGSRTGAEVTCCFDGSDRADRFVDAEQRTAATLVRGVRVLFSEPGMTADELIRRLARAEPPGRPVVVVSTDREVADGVRAAGARPVPSVALLRLLLPGRR